MWCERLCLLFKINDMVRLPVNDSIHTGKIVSYLIDSGESDSYYGGIIYRIQCGSDIHLRYEEDIALRGDMQARSLHWKRLHNLSAMKDN